MSSCYQHCWTYTHNSSTLFTVARHIINTYKCITQYSAETP